LRQYEKEALNSSEITIMLNKTDSDSGIPRDRLPTSRKRGAMNPLGGLSCDPAITFELRSYLRPGDLGAIVSLHGTIYADECGFDPTFEADIARLLGEFVQSRTELDRFWIAERDGRIVGSIAIISHSGKDAQLCWLLVDPSARFMGLGKRLLNEAVAFCHRCEYEYVFLRNLSELTAASHLFQSVGFEKVAERASERWGAAIVEEWYVLHPFGRRHVSFVNAEP
jgi:N-acetylglutamate synthase-like GNAT family acetyltransferase